jgi:hypothetical protein
LQDPAKFTQIGIFGSKIYHLATMHWRASRLGGANRANKKEMHFLVRGHCMCKEMPVIPVNKAVDPKRIIGKK